MEDRVTAVRALLRFIDVSASTPQSLHLDSRTPKENHDYRRKALKEFAKENQLRRPKSKGQANYDGEQLHELARWALKTKALPNRKAEELKVLYSQGTSVLDPHWLAEINYSMGVHELGGSGNDATGRSGSKPKAIRLRTGATQDPISLVSENSDGRVRSSEDTVEKPTSDYSPSNFSEEESDEFETRPGKPRRGTKVQSSRKSSRVGEKPPRKRGPSDDYEIQQSKKPRSNDPPTDLEHNSALADGRNEVSQLASVRSITNFHRIGIDQVEIKPAMDWIFSQMRTLADIPFESNGLSPSKQAAVISDPDPELGELYQKVLDRGHYLDRMAQLVCLKTFPASHMLVALVSAFLMKFVFLSEVPWTTPAQIVSKPDRKYLEHVLRSFSINLDEVLLKSCFDKMNDPRFHSTELQGHAIERRRQLTNTLQAHFREVLLNGAGADSRRPASAAWMEDWHAMVDEIIKKALLLKAKMNQSPEGYEVLWCTGGEAFNGARMEGVPPGQLNGEIGGNESVEVVITLCPGVRASRYGGRPGEVLAKTKVLLMKSETKKGA